jgi:hypothetical protein
MAVSVRRKAEARVQRHPDLFLSYSSRDKEFVRKLAEDLTFCQVDVWLDQWELQTGARLHEVIPDAVKESRFYTIVLSANSSRSDWVKKELRQARAREKDTGQIVVLPILIGRGVVSPLLKDRIYIDFRSDYYGALVKLAGVIHELTPFRINEAIQEVKPDSISGVIEALRYVGIEPYIVIGEDDFAEIAKARGSRTRAGRIRFSPGLVLSTPGISPRVRNLMSRLQSEVWHSNTSHGDRSDPISRRSTQRRMGEQILPPPSASRKLSSLRMKKTTGKKRADR